VSCRKNDADSKRVMKRYRGSPESDLFQKKTHCIDVMIDNNILVELLKA
jgi:hypothetical protein